MSSHPAKTARSRSISGTRPSGTGREGRALQRQSADRTSRSAGALYRPGPGGARCAGRSGRFPLIVVSHGRSNPTIGLSWLTENLASKGYVVAAIRHEDLPRSNPAEIPEMLLRRPLDLAFVTRSLQGSLAPRGPHRSGADCADRLFDGWLWRAHRCRSALDPRGPACTLVPGGLLTPYARAARNAADPHPNLKAVVAIAPGGGSWRSGDPPDSADQGAAPADRRRSRSHGRLCHRRPGYLRGRHGGSALPADLQGAAMRWAWVRRPRKCATGSGTSAGSRIRCGGRIGSSVSIFT